MSFGPAFCRAFLLGPGGSLSSGPKGLSLGSHFNRIVIHSLGRRTLVTMPGSSFKAVYHKPANQPQLVAKQIPSGTHVFRARAGWEACRWARSMGWIV